MNSIVLHPGMAVNKAVYTFHSDKDNTDAVLTVSKRELCGTYNVAIQYLGMNNGYPHWSVQLFDVDSLKKRTFEFMKSTAFAFKSINDDCIRIRETDDTQVETNFTHLNGLDKLLKLPIPDEIIELVEKAKTFTNHVYFNDSIAIFTIESNGFKVWVADSKDTEFVRCETKYNNNGHPSLMSLEVLFKNKMHLLELFPIFGPADVTVEDIKWDGKRLFLS